MLGEAVEALGPEALVEAQPIRGFGETVGAQPAAAERAVALAIDEPRPLEHLEMPRNRRQRDAEGLGELAHRRLPGREPRQNGAPRRIGEGGKGLVEDSCHLTTSLINKDVKSSPRPASSAFYQPACLPGAQPCSARKRRPAASGAGSSAVAIVSLKRL